MIDRLWDKLDPGFLTPGWLLAGLLAVVAVTLLEIGAYRRRKQAVRFFAAPHLVASLTRGVSTLKRLLKAILLVAAVGLLFIALARPHLLDDWRDESRSGLDVLIAVDCSKSMLSEDVKPSRIERAKLAISDFVSRLPDNRLGLIAFAGDAFLQCPLTLDHDAFQNAVRELDTDTIPRPGTDIATAIDAAVDALRSQPANMKFMILITDGEDLEGRVLDAARNAAQAGLKIYPIGVGTANGAAIPERDEFGSMQYHHDLNGDVVESKLDERSLKQIADITGGAYFPLGQQGEGLDALYDRYIAPLPRQSLDERREKVRMERFEWPLGLAILLLMWQFMTNERSGSPLPEIALFSERRPAKRRSGRRASAAVSVLLGGGLFSLTISPSHAANTDAAERDYKSGQYEEAFQNYLHATDLEPGRKDLQYDLGAAAYKAGEYSEAEDAFRKALETPDLNLQERTYYNLGNSQFQHGVSMRKVDTDKTIALWEQALHSYDSALKLKDANDTRHNYAVVKAELEELKKQQQQGKKNQKNSSQSNGSGSSGDQSQQNGGQGDQGNSQSPNDSGQNPQNGGSSSSAQSQNQPDAPKGPVKAYSGTRPQDLKNPTVGSRQDAENLLDSLKDDERHVSARSLNGDTQPPPTPSGKDW
jgi:Ca-activated chloride channel family protein